METFTMSRKEGPRAGLIKFSDGYLMFDTSKTPEADGPRLREGRAGRLGQEQPFREEWPGPLVDTNSERGLHLPGALQRPSSISSTGRAQRTGG
jgi:hypothetical protein